MRDMGIMNMSFRGSMMQHMKVLNMLGSEEDEDEEFDWKDWVTYKLEKLMAYSGSALFYLLTGATAFGVLFLGTIWSWRHEIDKAFDGDPNEDHDPNSYLYSLFVTLQVILSLGYDDSFGGVVGPLCYTSMLMVGLLAASILIGMITEAFESLVDSIQNGELKAIEQDHTLVLGWNESTVRLVCQIAFLRRQWQQMNETWERRILWWRRTPPSTPVAKGTVVILCQNKTKSQMEEELSHALVERGISKRRTRLGYDIVCRHGDPTDIHHLERVGAHRASAIAIHLDPKDADHSMVIRTLMAVRFRLLFSR
jgi:hypothetical protein